MPAGEEMWEEVEDGDMPPALHRLAHPEARLDESMKQVLRNWSLQP